MARCEMVGESESFLGRLPGRRPARSGVRQANANRGVVPAARDTVGRRCELHVHARVAFSQSVPPRGRAGPRRRVTRTITSGTITASDSPTHGRRRRAPPPRSRNSRSERAVSWSAMRRSSLPGALRDAAVANLSTLVTQTAFRTADGEFHGFEGVRRPARLLLRQLHARLELRNLHAVPVSQRRTVASQGLLRILAGRSGRDAISPDVARRHRPVRLRRRRRSDGPDHQDLSGLEAVRRYRVAARSMAAHPERSLVRMDSRRVGRQSRRRDGRRPAQHLRRRVLRSESARHGLLPGRLARRRGDGACAR